MVSRRKQELSAAKASKRSGDGPAQSKYAAKGAPPEYEFKRAPADRGRPRGRG